MTKDPAATALTQHIAAQMVQLRKGRGWTAVQLAEAVTGTGLEWDRFAVRNIEQGRRKSVTVDELLALASALQVPVDRLLPVCADATPPRAVLAEVIRSLHGVLDHLG